MKSISFLLILAFSLTLNAQEVKDTFEGDGTISTWYGDDCGMDNTFSNPFKNSDNSSAKVLKYSDTGGTHANIGFEVSSNFDLSTKNIFSFKIYATSNSITGSSPKQVSLKLQNGKLGTPWSTQSEIIKTITFDTWQTVTFDFANDTYKNLDPKSAKPIDRTDFNRVVVQVNGENNSNKVTAYIDDFNYNGTITVPVDKFTKLVWSDEFDGNGAINTTKWFHQTKLPLGGNWYNGEIQHYTNRVQNSNISNGTLKITAKKENFNDQGHTKQYTSARLNSKFAFTYGKVEIKAKLPTGAGTWPAIWMLGKNITETGAYWASTHGTTRWPACGEIDIMEHWGKNQNFVQSAMHTPSSSGNTSNKGGRLIPTASSDFHVYSLEWSSEKMVFKIDGIEHYTYNPAVKNATTWPFDKDQYILLNIAIEPTIISSFTEGNMEVDYVRVYQEDTASVADTDENSAKIIAFPNPVIDSLILQIPSKLYNTNATIYSISGKKIHSFKQNVPSKKHDFSTLKPGVYFIRFKSKKTVAVYQFIKE